MSNRDIQKEITEIKKDIRDIKETQEIDIQRNRQLYEDFVDENMTKNQAYVFLEVDGIKSQKEITDVLSDKISQPTVSRAINHLVRYGFIKSLEETKNGSPIYDKQRWAKVLYMNDYVYSKFLAEADE